jgi:chromosome segregation ATPase
MATARTTKTVDPIAERDALRRQLDAANAYANDARTELARLQREHGAATGPNRLMQRQREVAEVHIALAKGNATAKDLDAAKQRLADADEAIKAAIERNAVANRARTEVTEAIADVHERHADAFVADAMTYAARAHAAIADVIEAYTKAFDTFHDASDRWAEFTADVPHLSGPPRWPFATPAQLAAARCVPADASKA